MATGSEVRHMASEPEVIDVQPRRLLAIRRRVLWNEIGEVAMPALERLTALLRDRGIAGTGQNIFLYENPTAEGADLAMGVELTAEFELPEGFVFVETPTGRAATLTHFGAYDGLGEASRQLMGWCEEHRYELAGAGWEVYGAWSDDPSTLRTDIYLLLKT